MDHYTTSPQHEHDEPELTDESIMTWGKEHKGKALANVPADYLLWAWSNGKNLPLRLRQYIARNQKVLEHEVREGKNRPYQRTKL